MFCECVGGMRLAGRNEQGHSAGVFSVWCPIVREEGPGFPEPGQGAVEAGLERAAAMDGARAFCLCVCVVGMVCSPL